MCPGHGGNKNKNRSYASVYVHCCRWFTGYPCRGIAKCVPRTRGKQEQELALYASVYIHVRIHMYAGREKTKKKREMSVCVTRVCLVVVLKTSAAIDLLGLSRFQFKGAVGGLQCCTLRPRLTAGATFSCWGIINLRHEAVKGGGWGVVSGGEVVFGVVGSWNRSKFVDNCVKTGGNCSTRVLFWGENAIWWVFRFFFLPWMFSTTPSVCIHQRHFFRAWPTRAGEWAFSWSSVRCASRRCG